MLDLHMPAQGQDSQPTRTAVVSGARGHKAPSFCQYVIREMVNNGEKGGFEVTISKEAGFINIYHEGAYEVLNTRDTV